MPKRIVNLCGSSLVGAVDWLWERLSRFLGHPEHGRCVVLAFHSVTAGERSRFGRQMDVLLRRAKPVRADVKSLPEGSGRYAAITFDDGLQCVVDNALPELERRGIPSTLFIVTGVLGCNADWEYRGGDDPSGQTTMTEAQLRGLPSELVTIGSHTMSHPLLPSLGEEHLSQELLGSRSRLKELLGREVRLLSFPYGAFDDRVVERCRESGYTRVFTALPVHAFAVSEEFVSGRVGVTPCDWPIEFRLKLAGAYRWLPYAFAWKRRVARIFRSRVPVRSAGTPGGRESA
jgi:peptidoglycan/xylan/chitin deacetylase (PgdA/CDA1 family)